MVTTHGEQHTTRSFAAGAFEFAVATDDVEDRRLAESLFRDLPAPGPSERPPTIFSLLRTGGNGTWSLSGPRLGNRSATTLDAALKLLLNAVNLCALDAEPDSLHLHAAAATKAGRAVVIAAQRDVGKTTTVAHLVARGWGFVTDETVRLSAGTDEVTGIPKPLSIKPKGRALVEHLEPWVVPATDGADGFRFVPIGASGATVDRGGAPHLVVLLRRPFDDGEGTDDGNGTGATSGARTGASTRPIHPADAAVALMQETLDAERFGRTAARLAALAAVSHCYEVTIGTPDETADAIESLSRLDPVEPLEVSVLPASDSFGPGVVSVAVGDRTVVHDTHSGRILALDAGATRVWSRLGGWSVDDDIDLDGPVISTFVARLRALGLLAGAT
jgi:hypothetical protein